MTKLKQLLFELVENYLLRILLDSARRIRLLLFESFDKASGPKACREPGQTRPRTSLLFEPVENYLWINPSRLRSKDKKLPFEPVENRLWINPSRLRCASLEE